MGQRNSCQQGILRVLCISPVHVPVPAGFISVSATSGDSSSATSGRSLGDAEMKQSLVRKTDCLFKDQHVVFLGGWRDSASALLEEKGGQFV